MQLRHSVIFLSLSVCPYIHAAVLEGSLGFSGMVTEVTCSVTIGEGEKIPSSPTERLAGSVTVTFDQCPEKILKGISISLRDVSGDLPSPDFMHESGEKIVKGARLGHSLFSWKNFLEANLTLILSHPVSGTLSGYSAVFHMTYD